MSKRITTVVATLVLVGIFATAATTAAASGPTMTQFRRLQRQVNRIENRVNTLQSCSAAIPVSQFGDYEQFFDSGPITGLDLDVPGVQQYDVMVWLCGVTYNSKADTTAPSMLSGAPLKQSTRDH